MILTTTERVENNEVEIYLGLVTGTDVYRIEGSMDGSPSNQENLFGNALRGAMERMKQKASLMGAGAVIGIEQSITPFGGDNMLVTITGTAVKLAKDAGKLDGEQSMPQDPSFIDAVPIPDAKVVMGAPEEPAAPAAPEPEPEEAAAPSELQMKFDQISDIEKSILKTIIKTTKKINNDMSLLAIIEHMPVMVDSKEFTASLNHLQELELVTKSVTGKYNSDIEESDLTF